MKLEISRGLRGAVVGTCTNLRKDIALEES